MLFRGFICHFHVTENAVVIPRWQFLRAVKEHFQLQAKAKLPNLSCRLYFFPFGGKRSTPKISFTALLFPHLPRKGTLFISLASFYQFYGSSNEKVSLLPVVRQVVCCLSEEDEAAGPKISSSRRTLRESLVSSALLGFCQIKPDKWRETKRRKEKSGRRVMNLAGNPAVQILCSDAAAKHDHLSTRKTRTRERAHDE